LVLLTSGKLRAGERITSRTVQVEVMKMIKYDVTQKKLSSTGDTDSGRLEESSEDRV